MDAATGDSLPDPQSGPPPRLTASQWKSGIAAWLGWMFDGLDLHLYTFVAAPFVASLLLVSQTDPSVKLYSSRIQAAFLIGWALGGGVFGWLGDRLGRSRALVLTILTYALFTGLSFFAQTWWHLLICRFLAALGIGGEWAVGASLLAETWPTRWRPWIAAVLQSGVNVGILLASLIGGLIVHLPSVIPGADPNRCIFLVGVLPAFIVLWIRRAVPEPPAWKHSHALAAEHMPGLRDLFRGPVQRITLLTIGVCGTGLTAHWGFVFWYAQHLRQLPDVIDWSDSQKSALISQAFTILMVWSIAGNFVFAGLARWWGFRQAIVCGFAIYFAAMLATYLVPRPYSELKFCLSLLGLSSGVFALFTMYLPPLFPVLLRTTGAGFCYNIGRLAAAGGTMIFGTYAPVGDYRVALLITGSLFLPAALLSLLLPDCDATANES